LKRKSTGSKPRSVRRGATQDLNGFAHGPYRSPHLPAWTTSPDGPASAFVSTNAPINEPIYVTRPLLPPLEEFIPYLKRIWDNKILTNGGPLHQELEHALCEYLGVEHLALFTNGTTALVTALETLGIAGEVITTPYSFVATAHSLLWNHITPVFVDILPDTLNLDPAKVEAAITPQTTAILAVHCYGTCCDVVALQRIADKHNLKIVYDAAHAFAVRDAGGSVLRHGDLSVLSFHATKVFNTFEGGAIVCPDATTKLRIDQLKNFGLVDEVTVVATGINGKMSELSAAMGLLQLKHVDKAIAQRKQVDTLYRRLLAGVKGISCLPLFDAQTANHSYFPVLVEQDFHLSRDGLYELLRHNQVFARRYFYPLISEFPMYRGFPSARSENLRVATAISRKVLCLPIYPGLSQQDQQSIVDLIKKG